MAVFGSHWLWGVLSSRLSLWVIDPFASAANFRLPPFGDLCSV
jgi:hypothetical protein